jgi:hypothetical protein
MSQLPAWRFRAGFDELSFEAEQQVSVLRVRVTDIGAIADVRFVPILLQKSFLG